ncbi:hypothetical protein [Anaerostipes hadrus]|uniref:hypothetical protein n=1 Tax=Anaerostipes hadrus TaxID=649756 RepID=UPI00126A5CFC|nr:hypothetical protein [Anaerostipes hadrus]
MTKVTSLQKFCELVSALMSRNKMSAIFFGKWTLWDSLVPDLVKLTPSLRRPKIRHVQAYHRGGDPVDP